MSEQKFDIEKFKKAPYREQLKMLMEKARAEKDIYAMLVIHGKMKEIEKYQ